MSTIGIDISADQASVPAGDWLFIVHKATEGFDYRDPVFAARFGPSRSQAAYIGAYHYARPGDGHPGNAQADFFADVLLAAGFRPGEDLWQLDCEGTGNESTTGDEWAQFTTAFMAEATARLGNRGFLYVGHYFNPAFDSLVNTYPWWDPDYGPNNGFINPLPAGVDPVIHQYTSAGGFDKNVIVNVGRWNTIVEDQPSPSPALIKFFQFLASFVKSPLRAGAQGSKVVKVQQLLNRHGFHLSLNGKYDSVMIAAVKRFKIAHAVGNSDGTVVGRTCIAKLVA